MITVVADNTVLSNVAHTFQPVLLSAAFEKPGTVPAVAEELAVGVSLGRIPVVDWHWLPVVELSKEEQEGARRCKTRWVEEKRSASRWPHHAHGWS